MIFKVPINASLSMISMKSHQPPAIGGKLFTLRVWGEIYSPFIFYQFVSARLVWMLKSQRFLHNVFCVHFHVAKAPIKFIASRTGKSKLGKRAIEIQLWQKTNIQEKYEIYRLSFRTQK